MKYYVQIQDDNGNWGNYGTCDSMEDAEELHSLLVMPNRPELTRILPVNL